MTELEWVECTDSIMLAESILGPESTQIEMRGERRAIITRRRNQLVSERKVRLIACASCRRLWPLIDPTHCSKLVTFGRELGISEEFLGKPLDSCQRAIELSERAADEYVSETEFREAAEAASGFHHTSNDYAATYVEGLDPFDKELMASGCATTATERVCFDPMVDSLLGVLRAAAQAIGYLENEQSDFSNVESKAERNVQCKLIREIVGNPFRPNIFMPEWRSSSVLTLATQMYESRDFGTMPILAVALQDAGCDNDHALNHCRGPGPHVRGCWVVDLVLDKS